MKSLWFVAAIAVSSPAFAQAVEPGMPVPTSGATTLPGVVQAPQAPPELKIDEALAQFLYAKAKAQEQEIADLKARLAAKDGLAQK